MCDIISIANLQNLFYFILICWIISDDFVFIFCDDHILIYQPNWSDMVQYIKKYSLKYLRVANHQSGSNHHSPETTMYQLSADTAINTSFTNNQL